MPYYNVYTTISHNYVIISHMFYKNGISHATAAVILLIRFTALGGRHAH